MTEHLDPLQVHITGPGDITQIIPYMIGFTPEESLVITVIDNGRVALTARTDLADVQPPARAEALLDRDSPTPTHSWPPTPPTSQPAGPSWTVAPTTCRLAASSKRWSSTATPGTRPTARPDPPTATDRSPQKPASTAWNDSPPATNWSPPSPAHPTPTTSPPTSPPPSTRCRRPATPPP